MKKTKILLVTLISLLVLALATPMATFAATDVEVSTAIETELAKYGKTLTTENRNQVFKFLYEQTDRSPGAYDQIIASISQLSASWEAMGGANFSDLSGAQKQQLVDEAVALAAGQNITLSVDVSSNPVRIIANTVGNPVTDYSVTFSEAPVTTPPVVDPGTGGGGGGSSSSLIKQTGAENTAPIIGGFAFLGLLGAALLVARKKGLFASN